ncbi:hypothetical protein PENCOP_c009G00284 [Penicillium coprophilum]|uniref:Pentacotripeptide-repeat region of PRORP domain-containing protein n=1 Tax=Penicillium coprophilum TaxID=36646 RepID=A0A1V6UI04_9EURO|nr:hypothetical protein PENCOP_c009G00284 [Penicillium coprophilum]
MSSCPHQLVRSRLNGLLSQQCRSPGRLYRESGTANVGHRVRLSTYNAPAISEPGVGNDAPDPISYQHNHDSTDNSHPPTSEQPDQAATNRYGMGDGQSNSSSQPRRSTQTPIITNDKMKKVAYVRHADPKLVAMAAERVNREILNKGRHLTDRGLYLALAMRMNSLYTRELGLRQWKEAYGAIHKAKTHGCEILHKSALPKLRDDGEKLLGLLLDDCQGNFREAWLAMNRSTRAWAWQRLAIWLLQNNPAMALEFLLVTTEPRDKPDLTMIVDCLAYLERFHYEELRDWEKGAHTFESVVATTLDPKDWPIVSPPQRGIRFYIRRAGFLGVYESFRLMNERGITMEAQTALCYMYRFTQLNDVEYALRALEFIPKINDPEFSMNSEGVLRHCCKLLTLDTVEDKAGGRNFRILPRLLKMGVQPDRDMMNLVLANAYKTGDPQLGSDMLQFMKNHHHEFDSYTYLTLLTDAVSRGDRGRVDELVREVEMKEELRNNPYIFSKIFHAHFTFTAKHIDPESDPSGVFYSMLDMYNKLHDITPLKELLLLPPQYTQPPTPGLEVKIPPSPVSLFLMIATFFRCRNRISQVHHMYDRFRELVQQGHPSIAPLVETDHVYNEFLIAFRKSSRGLRSSIRLVEDMLDTSAMPKETTDGKPLKHISPTPRTWTILLSAFNYSRQPDAAEKVKEMMAKHDVKYNQVTWNTIINGFANAQDIPETANAITKMEKEGFAIDHYTMKSLRYLRDPERLWVAIEEMDEGLDSHGAHKLLTLEPASDVHSDQQERDELIDSGLEKLGSKLKPKM